MEQINRTIEIPIFHFTRGAVEPGELVMGTYVIPTDNIGAVAEVGEPVASATEGPADDLWSSPE